MGEYDKKIEGQCGTCKFALAFDYAPSPSGPEDGVHCGCEGLAKHLDAHTYVKDEGIVGELNQQELKEYGFLELWRLEALCEESYRCEFWEPKE
jgi:hypothetical protein